VGGKEVPWNGNTGGMRRKKVWLSESIFDTRPVNTMAMREHRSGEEAESFELGWIGATMSLVGLEFGLINVNMGSSPMTKALTVLSWISGGVGLFFSFQALKLSSQGE